MTIAFIGKDDSVRTQARIGLVSPQGFSDLAETLGHIGHGTVACRDWSAMCAESSEHPIDLVLCDEACIDDLPSDWSSPVVCLGDEVDLAEGVLSPLVAMAVELTARVRRVRELERIVSGIRTGAALVGNTPVMRRLHSAVARAADCDATVLIEGPSGSGKSLAARMIHLKSRRCEQPLVALDCESLTADELSGAIDDASKTTLILEAVDRLSSAAQSLLVRHLKERSTTRARSSVRLIATTSAHIPELVARGAFREDLFYRLHSFPILVPSLHERADDISALADAILDGGAAASGRSQSGFTPAARNLLLATTWPGNVAQLEAVIRRAQAQAGGATIDRDHLLAPLQNSSNPQPTVQASPVGAVDGESELTEDAIRPFEDEEKDPLGRALQATKGNVRRAAQLLGIGRATLYRKIQQYRLRLY